MGIRPNTSPSPEGGEPAPTEPEEPVVDEGTTEEPPLDGGV